MKTTKASWLQEVRQSHTARVYGRDRMMQEVARGQPNGLTAFDNGADDVGGQEGIADCLAHAVRWDGVFGCNLLIGFACFDSVEPGEGVGDIAQECAVDGFRGVAALLHGPEQIADLPVPVAESPGAVRIGHPERSHLVEYLAPNSVFNSLPRQRSSPHLRPDDRLVTIDRVLHHASLGVA